MIDRLVEARGEVDVEICMIQDDIIWPSFMVDDILGAKLHMYAKRPSVLFRIHMGRPVLRISTPPSSRADLTKATLSAGKAHHSIPVMPTDSQSGGSAVAPSPTDTPVNRPVTRVGPINCTTS